MTRCSYITHASAMARGTPTHPIRMDPAEWDELGSDAEFMGTDRSELIRQLVRWWMRKPGAKCPPRPPKDAAA